MLGLIMRVFCTIIDTNYLAQAQVLVNSLRKFHDEDEIVVLIIDLENRVNFEIRSAKIILVSDLDLSDHDLKIMRFGYDNVEFATSLKPFLLSYLLKSYECATYIDPDIEIFSSFDEITELSLKHGSVITPHRIIPITALHSGINDLNFMRYGVFNLGFISVSRTKLNFLDWWCERLKKFSTRFPKDHIFTDQKWIDLAQPYFDLFIYKNFGCNVAPWNLDERNLHFLDGHIYARTDKLVFVHFSQMSSSLAKGNTTNAWQVNNSHDLYFNESLKIISQITNQYGKNLNFYHKKFSEMNIEVQNSSFLPWKIRKKFLNNLDKSTYKLIFNKIYELNTFFRNLQFLRDILKNVKFFRIFKKFIKN
jgi:hypothetical protein